MVLIKILIIIFILFAVMILFMMTDELGNDEYSKFKKLKDKIGLICYLVIILGFIGLFLINSQNR